jgi:microcompartment protein CcmL/EutN
MIEPLETVKIDGAVDPSGRSIARGIDTAIGELGRKVSRKMIPEPQPYDRIIVVIEIVVEKDSAEKRAHG